MTQIRNYTPHPLRVMDEDDNVLLELQSEGSARVQTSEVQRNPIPTVHGDIPLIETQFGEAFDVPEPRANTFLVVSRIVAAALPDRDDLLVPNTSPTPMGAVRDEEGRIQGVRSLVRP
jgi:hypothetical protein